VDGAAVAGIGGGAIFTECKVLLLADVYALLASSRTKRQ
jgi:hypothetical protein